MPKEPKGSPTKTLREAWAGWARARIAATKAVRARAVRASKGRERDLQGMELASAIAAVFSLRGCAVAAVVWLRAACNQGCTVGRSGRGKAAPSTPAILVDAAGWLQAAGKATSAGAGSIRV